MILNAKISEEQTEEKGSENEGENIECMKRMRREGKLVMHTISEWDQSICTLLL